MDTGEIVAAYGAASNEPDEAKRAALLEESWADDGVYQDPQGTVERPCGAGRTHRWVSRGVSRLHDRADKRRGVQWRGDPLARADGARVGSRAAGCRASAGERACLRQARARRARRLARVVMRPGR